MNRLPVARDNLSLTSQFYYCALPLRLDSYSRCEFNCLYCFSNARGGNRGRARQQQFDVPSLERRLLRLHDHPPRSVIDEMLAKRQPIHLGGMSDPWSRAEDESRTTLRLLEVLAGQKYPTIISTKSDQIQQDEYLDVLQRGSFIVQASMSSTDARLLMKTDRGTPGPQRLLRAIAALSREGVWTACRIQPLLPGREADAKDVIEACAAAGVRHVAVEHLKLPLERSWRGTRLLSHALGVNLEMHFKEGRRIGRERLLPPVERLERTLSLREHAHRLGMTFGSADNDLLLLGDGDCCCSGADRVDGFEGFSRFNYTHAAREGIRTGRISITSLTSAWRPEGSIARYMNSRSRIPRDQDAAGAGVAEYVRRNWNGSPNGNSPLMFLGVQDHGEVDENGFRIYRFEESMRKLLTAHVRGISEQSKAS